MENRKTAAALLAAAAVLALSAGICHAQGDTANNQSRSTSAGNEMLLASDPVVITASQTPERVSDSPSGVTVITAEDIERSGAKTVPDLLRSVPGVDVMEANQSEPNVAIRGFNQLFANKLLVMVDGRSIYQDLYGTIFWNEEPLLLSRIERIEIVRGPGSALYGANAFGGVINIITKTPLQMAGSGSHADMRADRGSHNSTIAETNASTLVGGGWALSVGGGYHGTDGWGDNKPKMAEDSYAVPMITLDAQKVLPDATIRITANTTNAQADLDSADVAPQAGWVTSNGTVVYQQDHVASPLMVRAYENFWTLQDEGKMLFLERTYDFEIQQQRDLNSSNHLVYGASYRDAGAESYVLSGGSQSRQLWGTYLQDELRVSRQANLFGGLRLDDDSEYGTSVSPRLSLVQHLPNAQTVRLSYATAFRAPTLVESSVDVSFPIDPPLLYSKTSGNPDLKTEQLSNLEGGYRKDFRSGYAGLDLFYDSVTNLITFVTTEYAPSPPFPPNVPTQELAENIGGAKAYGLEAEAASTAIHGLRIEVNYSYQHLRDNHGDMLAFTPANKVNFIIASDSPSRKLSYRMDDHFVDNEPYPIGAQDSGQYINVGSYFSADAKVGYDVGASGHPFILAVSATDLFGQGHREYPNIPNAISAVPDSVAQSTTYWVSVETKW